MRRLALLALLFFVSIGLAVDPAPPQATVPSNALSLNGEPGQGVLVDSQSSFDVTTAVTIEAWINVPAWTKRYQAIVTKGEAWGIVRCDDKPKIAFRTAVDGALNTYDDLVSTKDFPLGVWTHVAAVFTGSRKQLYVNGEKVADAAYTGPLTKNDFPVMFGANAAIADRTLSGTLDSVRIWSVARTADQIIAFRNEYLRGGETGLLGEWPLNESAADTVVTNRALTGIQGVLQAGKPSVGSGSPPLRVNGLALNPPTGGGFGIFFQNTSAQYPGTQGTGTQSVQFPAGQYYGQGFSAELWVNPSAVPASGSVVLLSTGVNGWEIRYNSSSKVSFVTPGVQTTVPGGDPTEQMSKTRVAPGEWTHIAAIWDTVAKQKLIYINGVLDQSSPVADRLGQPSVQSPVPLTAGLRTVAPADPYRGAVDEVRIWQIVREPSEVLANFNRKLNGTEPGLQGVWSFDEPSGLSAADGSARAGAATLANGMGSQNRVDGVSLGEPLLGSYTIDFNGVDQYATGTLAPTSGALTDLTLEAWIKPDAAPTAAFGTIVQKGDSGFGLAIDPAMKLRFLGAGTPQSMPQSTDTVPLGVWSHVAVVVDGTAKTTTFYINGKPAGSVNTALISDSPGALAIGKRGGTSQSNFFNGGIDEVRIWTVPRAPMEILLAAFGDLQGNVSGLVARYAFTEGAGNTVANSAGGPAATLVKTTSRNWHAGPNFPSAPQLPSGLVLSPNPKTAGLWVGTVTLNKVNEVQKAVGGAANDVSPTSDTATIRVLLHVDTAGKVRLLKDVIVMQTQQTSGPTAPPKPVLVTDPSLIHNFQGVTTRGGKLVGLRYGSAAFDFQGFETPLLGGVGPGLGCGGRIDIDKLAPTNPYRHKYHPDHTEGFDIVRVFSFQFDGIPTDPLSAGPAYGVDRLTGTYRESIAGLHKITLKTEGVFILDRVSNVATLNKP